MLISLSIKDLAVVAALELDFESGFLVLTGETGAGKSILLTALGLALGDRADAGFVRQGAAKAEINLTFSLEDAPQAREWLIEHELLEADDETCLIRRVVSADGRSKAFINNRPNTLQALQELASRLVEIHGQHEHLHLLDAREQRRVLDESAGIVSLAERVGADFRRWQGLRESLDRINRESQRDSEREDLLRFQIDELEAADVEQLDYEALSREHNEQANVGRILQTGQAQLDLLAGDEQPSVLSGLNQAVHGLAELTSLTPAFDEIRGMLEDARIQVKEATSELSRQLDRMEADPARLAQLDELLGKLHRLARKHQVRPQELAEVLRTLREALSGIEHSGEYSAQLALELSEAEAAYRTSSEELSARRQAGAETLGARITALIRELGMPQGEFSVWVDTDPQQIPALHGADRIEFRVTTNPGLPPRPLAKVASGGELARISLAIQVAATDSKTIPTLVFDEVDTGIGGGVAEIVGQKLRALGAGRQVFCVTHLHQVAALGSHHLLVEKHRSAETTETRVRWLNDDERRLEIARMLGGVKITEQTLAHAAELLAQAQNESD